MKTPSELKATVCLVTCRRLPELGSDDRWLVDAFEQANWAVDVAIWDDPAIGWQAYDAVLIRSTWDYHLRVAEFRDWLDACEAQGVRLWNPPGLVRWNMHKGYLPELVEAGLPVVPTEIVHREEPRSLAEVLAARGWAQAVLKPAISATAYRTIRTSTETAAADQAQLEAILADADALIQPFVPEIASAGEVSFLCFGGCFTHAVLKRAKAGDFRVQSDFGGSETLFEPDRETRVCVERIAAAIPQPWLYARIDAVEHGGDWLLMELELIEPHLFFGQCRAAAARLVDALEVKLRHSQPVARSPSAGA